MENIKKKTLKPFLIPSQMQSHHYGKIDFKLRIALEKESKSLFEAELYESRTVLPQRETPSTRLAPPDTPWGGPMVPGGNPGAPSFRLRPDSNRADAEASGKPSTWLPLGRLVE